MHGSTRKQCTTFEEGMWKSHSNTDTHRWGPAWKQRLKHLRTRSHTYLEEQQTGHMTLMPFPNEAEVEACCVL